MRPRPRLILSIEATLLILALSVALRVSFPNAIDDLGFPFCGARAVLAGQDPYNPTVCPTTVDDKLYPTNPMTTIWIALPFTFLGPWGSVILWTLFTGLLTYGLLKEFGPKGLLIYTSPVYWEAFLLLQWSPLITAIALLPSLMPLALAKPHLGLPVGLTRFTWRRALACGLFLGLTLIPDPTWPFRWWATAQSYDGFIPLLVFPLGPLLLLALLRWRDPQARFLLLMAAVPQRITYDFLPLWLIPQGARQVLFLSAISWAGHFFLIVMPRYWPHLVEVHYLPSLFLVLLPLFQQLQKRLPQPAIEPEL